MVKVGDRLYCYNNKLIENNFQVGKYYTITEITDFKGEVAISINDVSFYEHMTSDWFITEEDIIDRKIDDIIKPN